MFILRWVGVGAAVGGAIGLVLGFVFTHAPVDSAIGAITGMPPGAVGGLIMGGVVRTLSTTGARMIAAGVLGMVVGTLYGITPLGPWSLFFTGPLGVLGGLVTACLLEDWDAHLTDA